MESQQPQMLHASDNQAPAPSPSALQSANPNIDSPPPEQPVPNEPTPSSPPSSTDPNWLGDILGDSGIQDGCFLTTAVTQALGMPDTSEPLELARYLRDQKMTSNGDRAAVKLYYRIAPTIVARSTDADWAAFWTEHMRKITVLIKLGEYDLAKDLYTFATASLINEKASRYSDKELVDEVYNYGLKGFAKTAIPYPVRFALLKIAFFFGLAYQSIRLGLAKKKLTHVLEP